MSLDERIRLLTESIIQEARGPIETALHSLLADLMNVAAADRDLAVQAAVAEAATSHQSALAAIREDTEREKVDVEAMRNQFHRELDASLSALREQLEGEHEARVSTLKTEWDGGREAQERALKENWALEHDAALAALRDDCAREQDSRVSALNAEWEQEQAARDQALRDDWTRDHDSALAALREDLTRDHDAALVALREELDRQHGAEIDAARGTLAAEHATALDALRQQLEGERELALAAAGADIERDRNADLAALRDELTRSHEAALKASLQAAGEESDRAHRTEIEAVESRAQAERDAAVQAVRDELGRQEESAILSARTAAEVAAAAGLTAALAVAEHGRAAAESRAIDLERELEQARADTAAARRDVVDGEQRARDAQQQSELVHVADRQAELECSERTLMAFRRLDSARSLSEVLQVLADQAAGESGRAVVFVTNGTRLRGWEVAGMPALDARAIDTSVEAGTIFGLAITTGLPVSTADAPLSHDETLEPALALPEGRAGLAVPISVAGRVVAILYADDGSEASPVVPSNWPEVAEILARHAGHRLEVLTVSHAAVLAGRVQQDVHQQAPTGGHPADVSPQEDERREEESARRYARLLISEIKLYNETAVEQGREHRDLLQRLGSDIERARRLYEEKIPTAVRQRVNCFDQEVVRTLAGGDADLLGQT